MQGLKDKIDCVLFDLDGTVVDSSEGIIKSVSEALNAEGIFEKQENLYKFIGPSLRYSFGFYSDDEEVRDRMLVNYRKRYRSVGWMECKLYDGIPELLRGLKEGGKKVVLASAKPEEFCINILKYLGVYDLFDFVGGATFDGTRDDKTVLLDYVFEHIGSPEKSKTAMIGDRIYDVEAAKNHGLISIGVKFGFAPKGELEQAGADYIVDTVADLSALLL